MIIFVTALAGGVGGALRFLVDTGVSRVNRARLPLGTVVVNVSACLVLGLVTGYALENSGADDLRAALGVGLMGGYSTFSTASVEAFRLLRAGRRAAALAHSGGMLAVSVAAALLGLAAGGAIA